MATDYARALGARLRAIRTAAGPLPARRRGEVRGPLEGGRGRLLRARRPRRHRASSSPSSPTSTACPLPSCCPTPRPTGSASRHRKLVLDLERLQSSPGREGRSARPLRRDDPGPARRLQRQGAVDPHGRPAHARRHLRRAAGRPRRPAHRLGRAQRRRAPRGRRAAATDRSADCTLISRAGDGRDGPGRAAGLRREPSRRRYAHGEAGLDLQQPAEQAVDEATASRRSTAPGRAPPPRRSPRRRARRRCRAARTPPIRRTAAVDGGHPLERPALRRSVRDQLVDPLPRARRRPRRSPPRSPTIGGCGRRSRRRSREHAQRVDAALVGLEEDVERPLAGLAAGAPRAQS